MLFEELGPEEMRACVVQGPTLYEDSDGDVAHGFFEEDCFGASHPTCAGLCFERPSWGRLRGTQGVCCIVLVYFGWQINEVFQMVWVETMLNVIRRSLLFKTTFFKTGPAQVGLLDESNIRSY